MQVFVTVLATGDEGYSSKFVKFHKSIIIN